MKDWTPERMAEAAGARLLAPPPGRGGPTGVAIDSRAVARGDLFVGLPGEHADGGAFAGQALAAGAWGVLAAPAHVEAARCAVPGVLLAADEPLRALGRLAAAWRRELGAQVIAVTGSTGKTSTKDILAALLADGRRTVASPANLNTDIGLPLAVLGAPAGTEALVLEVAMLEPGHIAELVAIAEPDVGVILNVGPVHLELLGTIEAVAAAKSELIAGLAPGTTVVVPAREPLLQPHLRDDVAVITFGDGGDVRLLSAVAAADGGSRVEIQAGEDRLELELSFAQAHNHVNLLAAVAAARAIGLTPTGRVDVAFSALRGERVALDDGIVVINDCYNANPMSMRAALDDLALAPGRRVAVLGDMLELGRDAGRFHAEVGSHAAALGIEVLVTVGELAVAMADAFGGESYSVADAAEAAAMLPEVLEPGDTVLVKASRGIGLEVVTEAVARPAQPANAGTEAGGA
jgi:UDP-N-acetylmuramoyl-tripeptide--D-alanyl-D-alanine ligase